MSAVTASSTQPMSIPWINARRSAPSRLVVSLEKRVTVLVEDVINPVADLQARVFVVELVAVMSLVTASGRPIESKRVRAHVADATRFAETVVEQMEWACHTCPGLTVEVSHDPSPLWHAVLDRLPGLPVPVRDRTARIPPEGVDLELSRRLRR